MILLTGLVSNFNFAESNNNVDTSVPLQEFKAAISQLSQFKGNFSQQTIDASGTSTERQSGHFVLQQPNRLLWKSTDPWQQLLVTNGKQLWLYDIDLEQVMIQPVSDDGLEQTPALLLFGNTERISNIYQFQSTTKGKQQYYHFTLHEQLIGADYNIKAISLSMTNGIPSSISFLDMLGQQTNINFGAVEPLDNLDASIFNWQVPEGVEVINES